MSGWMGEHPLRGKGEEYGVYGGETLKGDNI